MGRLAGSDIRVETYDDLLHRARKIYGNAEKRLKKIAPEYSREARRMRIKTNWLNESLESGKSLD